ncbi:3'(2'),5'-bisphosphate nucleotidase CysQ [bacterium]|nr:3'(2'),5'-bisphosphate nucleotidase CysQ [bacterium]MDC0304540.1 3'(2'),5'-bisphosphate nucleotidase CysQ [Akkermansiaceae bacterium]
MLELLLKIAAGAGGQILKHYHSAGEVFHKQDNSPLTAADLDAHSYICRALEEAYPEIPICSEEGIENGDPKTAERFWLVDPLDGTKEFIKRSGNFTVNIALIENGNPTVGVIHVPTTNLTYVAATSQGAIKITSDGNRVNISTAESQNPPRFVASRDHAGPEVKKLIERYPGAECLSIGSSLKFCLVAEGSADVYLRDVPTMEWDTAAAHAILREAGGDIYRWPEMIPLKYGKSEYRNRSIIAIANPHLIKELAGK